MKVILISGKARHGKDTVASIMQTYLTISKNKKVLIAHYGDLVKYVCKTFFDWNGEKDDAGRSLLQYVGTDAVRAVYPNYWVDFIADMLTVFKDKWDYVIIPDARFPNEITRMKEKGLDVETFRVIRPNFESDLTAEQLKHSSETALDNFDFDHIISNNSNKKSLGKLIINICENMME